MASRFQVLLREYCVNGFEPYPLLEMAKGIASKFSQVSSALGGSSTLLLKAKQLEQYIGNFQPVVTEMIACVKATEAELLQQSSSSSPCAIELDPSLPSSLGKSTNPHDYLHEKFEEHRRNVNFFLLFAGDYKFAREACSFAFFFFVNFFVFSVSRVYGSRCKLFLPFLSGY